MSKERESPREALKKARQRAIATAPDDTVRHVAKTLRIPRHGPMYVRCPTCNAQVGIAARRGVEFAILGLAMRLKVHLKQHEEGDGQHG